MSITCSLLTFLAELPEILSWSVNDDIFLERECSDLDGDQILHSTPSHYVLVHVYPPFVSLVTGVLPDVPKATNFCPICFQINASTSAVFLIVFVVLLAE